MKRALLFASLLTIAALLHILTIHAATAAGGTTSEYCCTDTCLAYTDQASVQAACPNPNDVVPGNCTAAAPTTCGVTGCCEIGGTGQYGLSKAACLSSGGTAFSTDPQAQGQTACASFFAGGTPVSQDSCASFDSSNVSFTANPVRGVRAIDLSWQLCKQVGSIALTRTVGPAAASPIQIAGTPTQYRDNDTTAVKWNSPYLYVYALTLTASSGMFANGQTTLTVHANATMGNSICEGHTTSAYFCDKATSTSVYSCSVDNALTTIQTCGTGECTQTPNGASCSSGGACQAAGSFLGAVNASTCTALGQGQPYSCYYDRGSSGLNGCFDCSQVQSCYSFKSQYACQNAATTCDYSGCVWEPLPGANGAGIGAGICKPETSTGQNLCSVVNAPNSGSRNESFSPLLSPSGSGFSSNLGSWYSAVTSPQQCSVNTATTCSGVTPGPNSASFCDSFQPSGAYGCQYNTTANYCEKAGLTDPYFRIKTTSKLCQGATGITNTCEADATIPQVSITPELDYAKQTITWTVHIIDGEKRITSLGGYQLVYCTNTTSTACSSPTDFTTGNSLTFTYPFSAYTNGARGAAYFSAAVMDPGYNRGGPVSVQATIDPTNPGPTLSFTGVPYQDGDAPQTVVAHASWTDTSLPGTITIPTGNGQTVTRSVSPGDITLNGNFTYGQAYTGTLDVVKNGVSYPTNDTFTLKEPSFWVRIDQPDVRGGFDPNKPFTISATPSQSAQNCRYDIYPTAAGHTYADLKSPMQGSGTSWRATTTRPQGGYLVVGCQQSGSSRTAAANLTLIPVDPNTKPKVLAVTGTTKLIFPNQNNQFITTLTALTNEPTTCGYNLSGRSVSGSPPLNTSNPIRISLSAQGTYQVNVVCKDALGHASDPYQVTITVDPTAQWYGLTAPSGYTKRRVVPYTLVTNGSDLFMICSIPDINVTNVNGTGTINGTFNADAVYPKDGTYTLTSSCIGYRNASRIGASTQPTSSRTTFTIDRTPPSVHAALMGRTDRIESNKTISNPFVSISYNDSSPIAAISYRLFGRSANGSFTLAMSKTLVQQPASPFTITIPVTFEDKHEYYVNVSVTDAAGNSKYVVSNRMIITLPNMCHNHVKDPSETGVDCGGVCGKSCAIGQTCTNTSDCAGDQAICTAQGVCGYAWCHNGKLDASKGETGVDCGGACGSCSISLVKPSFGVSATRNTPVVVRTTQKTICTWNNYYFDEAQTPSINHTIRSMTVQPPKTLNVSCKNDLTNASSTFTLSYDPTVPKATFVANPDVEVAKQDTPNGPAYVTELTVDSNVPVICRYSSKRETYAQMTTYLGGDYQTDTDATNYHLIQNEKVGYPNTGTYTIYTDCIAKNGLTTGPMKATFTANPNAHPSPAIVVPISDKTYSGQSLTAEVDGRSVETQACYGQLADFKLRPMTKAQGTIYTRDTNLVQGQGLDYLAVCSYALTTTTVNGTAQTTFTVDQTPPNITSVVIDDPNTGNTSVSHAPNGIEIIVKAKDAISGVAGYNYTIFVDGTPAASGTRTKPTFVDNTLNLSDGDTIRASVTAYDAVGNAANATSNTLSYSNSTPAYCHNNQTDYAKGETGLDCGGACGPCTAGGTPVCGDGRIQRPDSSGIVEQCDNGVANRNSCTAAPGTSCTVCTKSCKWLTNSTPSQPPKNTYCGDGAVQVPDSQGINESCDRGSANTNTACTPDSGGSCSICTKSCSLKTYTSSAPKPSKSYCGDGAVQTPNAKGQIEYCDWGTGVNTNTACDPGTASCSICTTSCKVKTYYANSSQSPVCGNGQLETGEQCDWGSANSNSCNPAAGTSCTVCTSSCTLKTISKPGNGPACKTSLDCSADSYCLAGTCQLKSAICTDGNYTPGYESGVDCGGACGSTCSSGQTCNANSDCQAGLYCNSQTKQCQPDYQAICHNNAFDPQYESATDCGDLCAATEQLTCSNGQSCSTNADCTSGLCVGGSCTGNFTPKINAWCTEDRFNNTIGNGTNATFCGRGCSEQCPTGVGCQLSSDCQVGLTCSNDHVCVTDNTTTNSSCTPSDTSPVQCGGSCQKCGTSRLCQVDSDCLSGVCDQGLCAVGNATQPIGANPTVTNGSIGESCTSDSECQAGLYCNQDNACARKHNPWKWVIFSLLIVLLGVAGYVAYVYFYAPNKKPDYQEGQTATSPTVQAPVAEQSSAEQGVSPPKAPPIMTEKQQHVSDLIRQQREKAKHEQRKELFNAFDDSLLDEAPAAKTDPTNVPKTPIETSSDDGTKPVAPVRAKRSHDTFKEILDDAKDSIE